ncbi:MAG: hypothetical protein JNK53_06550, partial [Phycisphaerae bacterium]|nr:hypothetical protein [Phycisphaerae bacterium]
IAAKRQAMATLGKTDTPEARAALVQVASDAALRHSLRAAAVETLAAYGSPEAKVQVLALFDAGCADPKVRAEQIQALATCAAADATPRLTALLAPVAEGGIVSYTGRAAAINALVALKATETLPVVRQQVALSSHGESVSQAALRALAKWGTIDDVPAVKDRTRLGIMDRARPQALETLAAIGERLPEADRVQVEVFLLALLDDPEARTSNAAGEALAALKSQAALPRLQAMADHHADPAKRTRAQMWVKAIKG